IMQGSDAKFGFVNGASELAQKSITISPLGSIFAPLIPAPGTSSLKGYVQITFPLMSVAYRPWAGPATPVIISIPGSGVIPAGTVAESWGSFCPVNCGPPKGHGAGCKGM